MFKKSAFNDQRFFDALQPEWYLFDDDCISDRKIRAASSKMITGEAKMEQRMEKGMITIVSKTLVSFADCLASCR